MRSVAKLGRPLPLDSPNSSRLSNPNSPSLRHDNKHPSLWGFGVEELPCSYEGHTGVSRFRFTMGNHSYCFLNIYYVLDMASSHDHDHDP